MLQSSLEPKLTAIGHAISCIWQFYKEVLTVGEYAKLAYYQDVIVGAVCCRIDRDPTDDTKRVYIMTLNCLAAYRRRGLGL